MDDTKLWLIGALVIVIVVATLVWVLRHRGDATTPMPHHDYAAPEVTQAGLTGGHGLTFGSDGGDAVDQTVRSVGWVAPVGAMAATLPWRQRPVRMPWSPVPGATTSP